MRILHRSPIPPDSIALQQNSITFDPPAEPLGQPLQLRRQRVGQIHRSKVYPLRPDLGRT